MSESTAIKVHQPCPDCGSSDALAEYSDGHTHCYSCGVTHNDNTGTPKSLSAATSCLTNKGNISDIPERGILLDTCKKYNVRVLRKEGEIAQHIYTYSADNKPVAQKIRTVATKEFKWLGEKVQNLQLFGQDKFPSGGKTITITEGEIDALSAYQMLGSKYPVVSLIDGASGHKAIKSNYKYLDSFETIYVCMDADEAGEKGLAKILQYLPPQKTKIMKLPADMKDANEFLKAGKSAEFINYFWRAEEYRPKDITNMGDTFARLEDFHQNRTYIPTGWEGVDEKIVGFRPSQFIVVAAGTGMGKSAILRDYMLKFLRNTTDKIGVFFLEETLEDSVISLMSMEAGKNFKRPDVWHATDKEEIKQIFDRLSNERRIEMFEGFTSDASENLEKKIRYLATIKNCKVIILDHITYLVDDCENIRQELNALVKILKELAVELNIIILSACHLRKSSSSNTHEEGGRVTLDDLKDSSSVKQLADTVIALERNSQEEDEILQNTTVLRVLKNRDFGDKGEACALYYDKVTTQFEELSMEEYRNRMLGETEE